MRTKEQLEAAIAPLQSELNRLRDAETLNESKALVGRCFKYRNCYSCPQTDADYWWLYLKVVKVGGYWPIAFQFQTDKDGRIEIETRSHHTRLSGYVEISAKEFNAAWRKVQKRVKALL